MARGPAQRITHPDRNQNQNTTMTTTLRILALAALAFAFTSCGEPAAFEAHTENTNDALAFLNSQ